jgi:hypothetical protein
MSGAPDSPSTSNATVTTRANSGTGAVMNWNTPVPANSAPVPTPTYNMMDPNWAQQFAVNVAGMSECITYPYYHYQNYPAAGTAGQLLFFNQIAGNPSTVTLEDTNMQAAGAFPAGTTFLLQGIGVDFLSGATAIARFGAQSANGPLNDFFAVMRRGVLQMNIGNKPYLINTNMLTLPIRSHINGGAATTDQTTPAAASQTMVQFGFSDGPVFTPRPLLIPSLQNFSVSISYPLGLQAIPSADASARIGVWLYGSVYRPVQ